MSNKDTSSKSSKLKYTDSYSQPFKSINKNDKDDISKCHNKRKYITNISRTDISNTNNHLQ